MNVFLEHLACITALVRMESQFWLGLPRFLHRGLGESVSVVWSPWQERFMQLFLPHPHTLAESDVQRLYVKDAQGNSMVDKSQLEKILLLNYVCNVEAGKKKD